MSRADRSQATDVPAPRSPAGGFGAADDPAAPSPPGSRSRPGDRSDDPARASVSLSMPALASGNQINGGFYKGFFRSLLTGDRSAILDGKTWFAEWFQL